MAQAEYVTIPIRALITGASAKPSTSPVGEAHAEFVAAMAGHPPRPIPLDGDAIDLEDRADHLDKVFGAFSVYVTVILDDTAQNVPGNLDAHSDDADQPSQRISISHSDRSRSAWRECAVGCIPNLSVQP